ncbi:hypothetical protein JOD57_004604 [Geodermatophilus bullaregiensis]|uniref:hypothetical protein n=1 Tax=Geodermatophilus bullaregiensis TaxID=1564160 RepID=UPI00195AC472|nr:hypothetical protein [Geodermatophilus bullaregiensis]MBM7808767.1 hypothetical protein [Geodermatophilus bullaregiensis]
MSAPAPLDLTSGTAVVASVRAAHPGAPPGRFDPVPLAGSGEVLAVDSSAVVRLTHALLPPLEAHPGGIRTRFAGSVRVAAADVVRPARRGR